MLSSIKSKLVLILGLALAAVFSVSGFIAIRGISTQTREDARLYMESLSREYANRFKGNLETPMNLSTTLATAMEEAESVPLGARRSYFLNALRSALEKNESYFAVWTMWEPDELDGADDAHRGRELLGSDADGRFTPFFYRENGSIQMEASSWDEENGEDFYSIPKTTLKEYLTEPYPYEVKGKTVQMVSTVAPILREGRFVGVVGVDLSLEGIAETLGTATLYRTGFGRLVSYNGVVVVHQDPTRIGEIAPEWSGEQRERVSSALKTGKAFTEAAWSVSLKRTTLKSFIPIFIANSPYPWMYGTVVPEEETYENIAGVIGQSAFIIAAGFIAVILAVWFVGGNLLNPLRKTQLALKEIAEGDGDLTKALDVRTNDETGALAQSFNQFVEKLRSILATVGKELADLSALGEQLGRDVQGTTSSIMQINGTVSNVGQSVNRQKNAVAEVSATIEQIVGNIASLDKLIDEQGRSLERGASAVEEMVANIQSITRNIDAGKPAFAKLRESSDTGFEKLESVGDTVSRIAEKSSGLEETNAVITTIASQTNLLAMNAAIEAAHAGEAGKGFAVVADEIRKLAEDTALRSREISGTLEELGDSIRQAVELSAEAGKAFEFIRTAVDEVTDRQEEIRSAVAEQSEGNKVVLESMERLKRIGTEVGSGSAEMSAGSASILRSVHQLSEVTGEVNQAMEEISEGTAEINASAMRISELSNKTSLGIGAVKGAVGRFKV